MKYDYVSFQLDGTEYAWLGGSNDWTNVVCSITGTGEHTLKWEYVKNAQAFQGEDCAWLDQVVWMSVALPELSSSATADDVAQALSGAVDAKLPENIKTVAEYSAFRSWAVSLSEPTLQQVKESPNAWLSYILDASSLIEGVVTEERLKVSSFELSGENNLFSIKLKLDGVDIGDAATVETLLKVFAVEGAKELSDDSFSVDNVALEAVQPIEGEIEFIVTPRVKGSSFFFRVRMRDNTNGVGMNSFTDKRKKVQLWEGGPYWATTNIGAEKPWESGYYFWWGDTVGYKREGNKWVASDGSNSNFSFTGSNTPTNDKDNSTLQSEGWITSDGFLAPEHDAAEKHWGGDWRMPTKQEIDDLIRKCDWTWTRLNGVNGYVVCGKGDYASASIFLPCAGYGDGTSIYYDGSIGYFWSSVPLSDIYYYSWSLYFYSGSHSTDYGYRVLGQSVRPVQGAICVTVTFDTCGGSSVESISIPLGQALGELPTPTRDGYTFLGWFTASEGGNAVTSESLVTADMTIYARWESVISADVHEKVQLWEGGPYWATTNIGAEKPEDYGYYFWWGDTVGYKYENDKWVASDGSNSNFSFSRVYVPTYNKSIPTLQSEGWITAEGVLAPKHDAAKKHWGGDWRMPTKQEFADLISKCDWTWTTMNGVNGYVVCGKGDYASASIFFPCAGSGGISLSSTGSYGCYWSSVPGSDSNYAWYLYFFSSDHGTSSFNRDDGQPVRPVQGFTK